MEEKINGLVARLCEDFDREAQGLDTGDAMYLVGGILTEFFIVSVEACVKEPHRADAAEILLAALRNDIMRKLKRKESPMDLTFTPNVAGNEISLVVGGFNESVLPALTNVDGITKLVVGTAILDSSITLFEGILAQLITIRDDAATSGVG